MVQPWRLALRPWRRRPWLALAVVISLGMSLALSIAMSAVLTAVKRQAELFPNGPALVWPARIESTDGTGSSTLPSTGYAEWRRETAAFSTLAAYQRVDASIRVEAQGVSRAVVTRVSGNFFDTLGVASIAGRVLRLDDEGAVPCAVVVTHRFAAGAFGGQTAALERPLLVEGQACRVVGVVSDHHAFPSADVELFAPLTVAATFTKDARGRMVVSIAQVAVIGAPRPGVHPDAMAAEASHFLQGPSRVVPLNDLLTASYRRTVELLTLCSLLVLGVAIFNVAAVMAAHAVTRLGEWQVKGALGASRRHLWRETTRETAVVCLAGAAIGFALAAWGTTVLAARGPSELSGASVSGETSLLWLMVTAALIPVTALPASWQAARLSRSWSVSSQSGAAARSGRMLGPGLLVAQLAGAVALVSTTLLFATTLRSAFLGARGFDADGVVMIPTYQDGPEDGAGPYLERVEQARRRLVELRPGIEAAVASDVPVPVVPRAFSMQADDDTRGVVMHGPRGSARITAVGPGYFQLMGIHVAAGREFTPDDGRGGAGIAVVSASLARQWFGSADAALGKPIRVSRVEGDVEIVGVAGDVRRSAWDAHELPVIYVHVAQVSHRRGEPSSNHDLLLLAKSSPPSTLAELSADSIGDDLQRVAPNLALGPGMTIRRARIQEVEQVAAYVGVATAFGVVTILLVALGVFAAASHVVAARTREIAIRQALGATPTQARRAITTTVAWWWAWAAAGGVLLSVAGAKIVAATQAGLMPMSITTVAASVVIVTAALVVAAWIPVRRALRIEPAVLMREN